VLALLGTILLVLGVGVVVKHMQAASLDTGNSVDTPALSPRVVPLVADESDLSCDAGPTVADPEHEDAEVLPPTTGVDLEATAPAESSSGSPGEAPRQRPRTRRRGLGNEADPGKAGVPGDLDGDGIPDVR
jgi:hypothetical protein